MTGKAGALPTHGGDIADAIDRWGDCQRGWLDLSTGLNPWPWPSPQSLPPVSPECWRKLPDRATDLALRQAAAAFWKIPSATQILSVPGTGALIRALPHTRPTGLVAIYGPTYREHELAWTRAGHHIRMVKDWAETPDADVVVVVNPNNPDGRKTTATHLAEIARTLTLRRGLLVVDEAFGDVVPECSVAHLHLPNTLVMKSFGKFHGLAGLRLGFAVAAPKTLAAIADLLGPWPVSGPALELGRAALLDMEWRDQALARLSAQSQRLGQTLSEAGLTLSGGTPLFQSARHPAARDIWDRLGRAGILVRAFADQRDLLRFGLPADDKELERLKLAL